MRELFRKELRLQSEVIAAAVVLLVASFPLAFLGIYMQGLKPFPWISVLGGACALNQYTMILTGALLGATAFAREREDGNVHFLAFLPVTRLRQFAAKIGAGMVLWAVPWALNVILLIGLTLAIGEGLASLGPFVPRMLETCVYSFAALGFASFIGCYVASVVGAAFSAIGGLVVVVSAHLVFAKVVGGSGTTTPFFIALLGALSIAALVLTGKVYGRVEVRGSRLDTPARIGKNRERSSRRRKLSSVNALLLWKDARLLRSSIVVGMLLFSLPFVVATGTAFLDGSAASGFRVASIVAMMLGWVVLPMWSAGSLANEWAASSDQFLGYLPVSSWRVVASKFVVAIVPALLVFVVCVVSFIAAETRATPDFALDFSMSWTEFGRSDFLSGAVAYAGALPVTFCMGWYFAARLRRRIVAIVIGILSGPVAMATWAISSLPGGYAVEHLLPTQAIAIHISVLAALCASLVILGAYRMTGRTNVFQN